MGKAKGIAIVQLHGEHAEVVEGLAPHASDLQGSGEVMIWREESVSIRRPGGGAGGEWATAPLRGREGGFMGLDTSHDCWHGAYSAFMRFRNKVSQVAGYGDIEKRQGFCDDGIPWPSPELDPLVHFLNHSDCDGEIEAEHCAAIADRLEALLPAMEAADSNGPHGGHLPWYKAATERWITGLREAAKYNEPVEFH